jgi:hypothetical protein
MAQMSSRDTKLLCSLFIVIGLVAVGIGIWMFSKSLRAEHWPVTDGIVQSAEMKSQSGNHGSTTYSAEVTYTYQVAGASYTGDKVSIGQMSSSSGYAQGILNRYPVGKKISVHYSPGDPADAACGFVSAWEQRSRCLASCSCKSKRPPRGRKCRVPQNRRPSPCNRMAA